MDKKERDELIEEYARGFDILTAALDEIPREAWDFKPEPKEWSVHEVVIHMADSETLGVTRLRKLIAEPGGTLMAYDDAKWAEALHYQDQSMEDALQLFRLMRRTNYPLLRTLPDPVFAQTLIHPEGVIYPEYGPSFTLDKWLHIYTRHVRDHIQQMKNNLQAWNDRKK